MTQSGSVKVEPIGVLGLGHVGLPTAVGLAEVGWTVIGADDDRAKAEMIARGQVPFYEPGLQEALQTHLRSGRLHITADTGEAVQQARVLFVCVGTPLSHEGLPDLSQVEAVARTIAHHMNGYKLIVEKSTTPVGTAKQIEKTLRWYSNGQHAFDVAVNPEFLQEGTALRDFLNPSRIVLGVDSAQARDILLTVYQPFLRPDRPHGPAPLIVTDTNTAELIKHASNAFLSMKISFINLMADVCEAVGANVDQVARGLGLDPRIGPHFLRAGIGYGGSCLPKDLKTFVRVGESLGVDMGLLREVDRINEERPLRFVQKLRQALWNLKGKTVAIWGLAFKPGTDDMREAPSITIIKRLLAEGARLRLYDPQALPTARRMLGGEHGEIDYSPSPYEAVREADALLVLTEWPEFLQVDMASVRRLMRVPILGDGRNLFDPQAMRALGFGYFSVGRP
ncbi:MAG: UDP-glucose/GDP-mannose dehydrogenase family protein [Dehalococcoidia bacterium]|nr:UDP-glucose/GDP-mannose dehydrogenase family protein [Dehalococcoidia bacterium]MDW8119890.1 UDP-glucose/GDP-mannose dehydrogenase family protein [Chloroflexota bacterium]